MAEPAAALAHVQRVVALSTVIDARRQWEPLQGLEQRGDEGGFQGVILILGVWHGVW